MGRAWAECLDGIEAVKWVFVQESQAGVNGSASPGFQGSESHLIQLFHHREHLFGAHSGCSQGLMPVSQDGVVENNWLGLGHLGRVRRATGGFKLNLLILDSPKGIDDGV